MSANSISDFSSLAALRRRGTKPAIAERCELCAAAVGEGHAHLFEPRERRVQCACEACALLLGEQAGGRFRRIPTQVVFLNDCRISDAQWASLGLPINLAFLFRLSANGKVAAIYPSPAGPTESLLALDSWAEILAEEPRLRELRDDVEALLVNRLAEPYQYFIAPIDQCYRLVGIIRTHWRGFTGGTEVWKQVAHYFDELRERASPAHGARHA